MISDVGPILHDPRKLLDQYTALPRCKEKRQDANCGASMSGLITEKPRDVSKQNFTYYTWVLKEGVVVYCWNLDELESECR